VSAPRVALLIQTLKVHVPEEVGDPAVLDK